MFTTFRCSTDRGASDVLFALAHIVTVTPLDDESCAVACVDLTVHLVLLPATAVVRLLRALSGAPNVVLG